MMLQCRAKEKDMAELFGKKYTKQNPFYADVHRRSRFFPDG